MERAMVEDPDSSYSWMASASPARTSSNGWLLNYRMTDKTRRHLPASQESPLTGTIAKWDHQKGYGFLQAGKALDKRRAREHGRRIPENLLHLTELCGGWPGAFLAQRRLRHKVSKVGFQVQFWLIVLTHQLAAYDSLQHWQLSRAAWDYFNSHAPQQITPARHPRQ